MLHHKTSEADVLIQLAKVRSQIETPDGIQSISLLNNLRRSYPKNHEVAFYWCKIAMDFKQYKKVIDCSQEMFSLSDSEIMKIRWTMSIAIAQLMATEIKDALDSNSKALNLFIQLSNSGKIPRQIKEKKYLLSHQGILFVESRLWHTLNELKSLGIAVFPMFGTLLGLIREGTLLQYDKDIDIGVWIEDFKGTCNYFRNKGMIQNMSVPAFDNFASFIDKETRLTYDVCGFRRMPEKEQIVGGFWLYHRPAECQRITLFPWFDLIERKTGNGQVVWWPTNAEKILTTIYGDWRTPKPEWDSIVSALNIQPGSLLQRCYAYSRLSQHWIKGDIAKTRRYIDQIEVSVPSDPLIRNCRVALDKILSLQRFHHA